MEFLRAAKNFRFGTQRSLRDNDFFADRLSHRHTTKILIVFLLLATFKRFFTSPINCWVPAELRRYEKFINKYCWLQGTYYVDQVYDINTLSIEARNENLLQYYQWIYFFLLVQAFLFYFPRMIWCFVSYRILDYDLFNMVDAAIKHDTYSYDHQRILKYLSSNITNHHGNLNDDVPNDAKFIKSIILEKDLKDSKDKKKQKNGYNSFSLKIIAKRLNKSILTFSYISIKCLYLVIAILQIYLMNAFLSSKTNSFFGYEILKTILSGEADLVHQSDSKIFPRITICDVKTKELGTDHTYTVQCVLSFNMFNERIYAFLWFWIFLILIPFTVIDLISWMKRVILFGSYNRYQYVKSHIKIFNKIDSDREKFLLKVFTELYLGSDGVFLFRLLEHNSNSIVVSDLFKSMWVQFKQDYDQ
jgi:hypothetical protein